VAGPIRWVNQYAYDQTWKGRKVRVFIKRLRPLAPVSTALLGEANTLASLINGPTKKA
jgi:hypothetical protein